MFIISSINATNFLVTSESAASDELAQPLRNRLKNKGKIFEAAIRSLSFNYRKLSCGIASYLLVLLNSTLELCIFDSRDLFLFSISDDVTNFARESTAFVITASNSFGAEIIVPSVEDPPYLINFLKAALATSFSKRCSF